MSQLNADEVGAAVSQLRSLADRLANAGMPPDTMDKLTSSLAVLEQAAAKGVALPDVKMSAVTMRKVGELVANGFSVCGFTLEKEGNSSAVMFDSATRWLTPEERQTLMTPEAAKARAAADDELPSLPAGGITDEAMSAFVMEAVAARERGASEDAVLMGLARKVRAAVYKAGPVTGLIRARLMVRALEKLLKEAEGQGFGKVTVQLVRNTMSGYLPLSDESQVLAVDPSLLTAAQAVVDAERGDHLCKQLITNLATHCDAAVASQGRVAAALSPQDIRDVLSLAMADPAPERQAAMVAVAEKVSRATGDVESGRLVESVRRSLASRSGTLTVNYQEGVSA